MLIDLSETVLLGLQLLLVYCKVTQRLKDKFFLVLSHLTPSRIEWVWLHWSEYLKAYEEFELWLMKQQRSLDTGVELQLGVKEKLWQVDQQRVMVSDVHGQATLLERLLDEAAALHNRTQDPSVDSQAQERLREAYNNVRDRAEVRCLLALFDSEMI